jgi:hypothetical protein
MKKILTAFIIFSFFNINLSKASHSAGGELLFKWISDSTYRFTMKFYRDCTGINEPDSFGVLCKNLCLNSCKRLTLNKILLLPNGDVNGTPIIHNGNATYCMNIMASLPGYQEWWYEGEISLNGQCQDWEFIICEVARNPSSNIMLDSNGYNLLLKLNLDNLIAQGNSSPVFINNPIPYAAINSPWIYSNAVTDIDGDSFSYKLILPYTSTTSTNVNSNQLCNTPYVYGNVTGNLNFPLYHPVMNVLPCDSSNPFRLDTLTGEITATPNLLGRYTFSVEITEWRNSQKISVLNRDIQLVVIPFIDTTALFLKATRDSSTRTITCTASKGSPPYAYSIDNSAFQQSNVFLNVTNGIHLMTVKDADNSSALFSIFMNGPVAIHSEKLLNQFSFFPNPSEDFITISNNNSTNEHLIIELFDILGKRVLNQKIQFTNTNSSVKIDISNLIKGTYFSKITNQKSDVSMHTIVVQ